MEIPGLRLVKNVPKPYPEAGQTVGLHIHSKNPRLPSWFALTLLDTTYEDGMHAISIDVSPTEEAKNLRETALTFANSALELLDLPSVEELDPSGGLAHELGLMQIGAYCNGAGSVKITEEQYNAYYELAMRSDFVQGEEGAFVTFALSPTLHFGEHRLRKIYRRDYPWVDEDELGLSLSPVVNQVFNLCGMLSEEPYDAYLFAGAAQNIDDTALPHPIPNMEDVEGFFVPLRDATLPECRAVCASESVQRLGLYELQAVLTPCPYPEDSEEEAEWVSENVDAAFERLNIPSCAELLDYDEDYPDALELNFRRGRDKFIVELQVTREVFEELYVGAARSSFVQLSDQATMLYILNEKAGVDFDRARESYLGFYERVRETLEPGEEMLAPPDAGREIRALVDKDQNLLGFCEPTLNGLMTADYVE